MTISEAITKIDALRPNMYTDAEKIGWLSKLDGMIYYEILGQRQRPPQPEIPRWPNPLTEDGTWEPYPEPPAEDETTWTGADDSFTGYSGTTATTTALLVPYPYDQELYVSYLMMMVDEANGEIEKYNQSSTLYNNALLAYRNFVNRQRPAAGPRGWRW